MEDLVQNLKLHFKRCACIDGDIIALKSEAKCQIFLINFPEKVILDVDCIAKDIEPISGKKCDFVAVVVSGKKVYLIPIEFKTHMIIPEEIEKQISGGIKFFQKTRGIQFLCYPVLVSDGAKKKSIKKKLKGISILYGGGKMAKIHWLPCNNGKLDFAKVRANIG